MTNKVGLKISPSETLYIDIAECANPIQLGWSIQTFVECTSQVHGIYGKLTVSCEGWTTAVKSLGELWTDRVWGMANTGDGGEYPDWVSACWIFDRLIQRDKPSGECEQTISLLLEIFSDEAMTQKITEEEVFDKIVFIDSNDSSWNVDMYDDFNDGTWQGWSAAFSAYLSSDYAVSIASDHYRSPPYSAKIRGRGLFCVYQNYGPNPTYCEFSKEITTSDKDENFVVIRVRADTDQDEGGWTTLNHIHVYFGGEGGTTLRYAIGNSFTNIAWGTQVPKQRWLQITVPLPKNTTGILKVTLISSQENYWYHIYAPFSNFWMDDVKIISRN